MLFFVGISRLKILVAVFRVPTSERLVFIRLNNSA